MFIESEQLPSDFMGYADDFKKDILAFAQFMKDTDLKPLAIEIVLTNPEDGYAGAIDLDNPNGLENNVTELSLSEVVKKRKQEQTPEITDNLSEISSKCEDNTPELGNTQQEEEKPKKRRNTAKSKD